MPPTPVLSHKGYSWLSFGHFSLTQQALSIVLSVWIWRFLRCRYTAMSIKTKDEPKYGKTKSRRQSSNFVLLPLVLLLFGEIFCREKSRQMWSWQTDSLDGRYQPAGLHALLVETRPTTLYSNECHIIRCQHTPPLRTYVFCRLYDPNSLWNPL